MPAPPIAMPARPVPSLPVPRPSASTRVPGDPHASPRAGAPLQALRDAAPEFYGLHPGAPVRNAASGAGDGWLSTMVRTFQGRGFYACAGVAATEPMREAAPRPLCGSILGGGSTGDQIA